MLGPLGWRAAVPLYHVGERVSVQMSVCAPVPHKMVEGCIVKENSGRIPAASPVHVSMFTAEDNIYIYKRLPAQVTIGPPYVAVE